MSNDEILARIFWDVRPVVLCRDCVHFSAHSGTGSGYCGFLDIGTSQEAFCSHGKREE